jgi:hypothetical protein
MDRIVHYNPPLGGLYCGMIVPLFLPYGHDSTIRPDEATCPACVELLSVPKDG